jgi:hypothetical protein
MFGRQHPLPPVSITRAGLGKAALGRSFLDLSRACRIRRASGSGNADRVLHSIRGRRFRAPRERCLEGQLVTDDNPARVLHRLPLTNRAKLQNRDWGDRAADNRLRREMVSRNARKISTGFAEARMRNARLGGRGTCIHAQRDHGSVSRRCAAAREGT